MTDVSDWMETVSGEGWVWYLKRLAANDTLANKSHQAGPYIPNSYAFRLFPSLEKNKADVNPRVHVTAAIDSDSLTAKISLIYYNNKSRNECRFTGWGGKTSPILDPDSTGSLCIFAFRKHGSDEDTECRVWLCTTPEEEEHVEDRVTPVEPGNPVLYDVGGHGLALLTEEIAAACWLNESSMPTQWKYAFPLREDILAFTVSRLPSAAKEGPDKRLLQRRDCEYAVFRSIEDFHVHPRIKEGFKSVDIFIEYANSVTNRRKNRAGKSLELNAARIFDEEDLPYSPDKASDAKKRPDFLFPSVEKYRDKTFPSTKLRMLAAKTTCKDRWRQILTEANRIPSKHLLTEQRGISENQFAEMQQEGVVLVVPKPLIRKYPKKVRPHLVTLEKFIAETKKVCF